MTGRRLHPNIGPLPVPGSHEANEAGDGEVPGVVHFHTPTVHHAFRLSLECPACGINLGLEFRSDAAAAHLRDHGMVVYALPPWAYQVAEVEINPAYGGQCYILPIHMLADVIERLIFKKNYVALHVALAYLWKLGLHRQLNVKLPTLTK